MQLLLLDACASADYNRHRTAPKLAPLRCAPTLASPCSQVGCQVSSYTMAPREAQGAWLHCGRGGNTLPLPMRLQAAGQTPASLQLAGTLGCLRQLSGEILKLHTANAPALNGLPSLCAVGTAAMGAESAGLITAHQMGVGVP